MKLEVSNLIPNPVEILGSKLLVFLPGENKHYKDNLIRFKYDGQKSKIVQSQTLLDILSGKEELNGIIFLGGEPFDAPLVLSIVGGHAKKFGKMVILVTGHTFEELCDMDKPDIDSLLDVCDVLYDGEYIPELDEGKGLGSSTNQRIIDVQKSLWSDRVVLYDHFIDPHRPWVESQE